MKGRLTLERGDRYEGLDYRAMIAWSARLQREWPMYEQLLADAPHRTLLDLGCGPGEHCARFTAEGWTTLGVDVSSAQIRDARAHHPDLEFAQLDLAHLGELGDRTFGAVLCVGNVLPGLDDETFDAMLDDLSSRIVDGGRLLLHQLEFGPILAGERRSIGPVFTRDEQGESAFIRIFCAAEDPRFVDFFPTRLRVSPGTDPPVSVERVESIRMRARRREEIEAAMASRGFAVLGCWGSPERTPHDGDKGQDLWLLAGR